jgi:hypothetical protein
MSLSETISSIHRQDPKDYERVRVALRDSKSEHGEVETKELNKQFHIPGYRFIKREKVLQLVKDGIDDATRPQTPASVQQRFEDERRRKQFRMFPELRNISDPSQFEEQKQKLASAYLNGIDNEPKPTKRMKTKKDDNITFDTEETDPAQTKNILPDSVESPFSLPSETKVNQVRPKQTSSDVHEMINRISLEHTINASGPEAQKLSQKKTALIKRVLAGEIGNEESKIESILEVLRTEILEITYMLTERFDKLENTLDTPVERIDDLESQNKSIE